VYLLVSLMLMYGSVKGSRWFLLPWLVATLLFILAYMVGMVLSTILFGLSVLSLAFLAIAIVEVTNLNSTVARCHGIRGLMVETFT
jgi:hypothetical protein